jgi:hypothetical protein
VLNRGPFGIRSPLEGLDAGFGVVGGEAGGSGAGPEGAPGAGLPGDPGAELGGSSEGR